MVKWDYSPIERPAIISEKLNVMGGGHIRQEVIENIDTYFLVYKGTYASGICHLF